MAEFDRRDFLKLVGASAGGAAAAGCSDPVEKLIPYVIQPEELTPGLPLYYASTCQECPAACGLRVTTRESRPVKLEGNPEHPINRGKLCPRGQAGIGRTYHPDRFRGPQQRTGADGALEAISREQGVAMLAEKLRGAGAKTRVLGGATGPTLSRLIDDWVKAVGAGGRVVYEPFAGESLESGTRAAFGAGGRPIFDLSDVDLVLDFGSDFLATGSSPVEHAAQLAAARDVLAHPGGGARVVAVGPRLAMTTDNADEWLPAKPGSEGVLALALAKVALEHAPSPDRAVGDPARLARVLAPYDTSAAAVQTDVSAQTIEHLGRALAEAERPVALPPGVALTGTRATAATAAVMILNAVVGAIGRSVRIPREDAGSAAPANLRELTELVEAMRAGEVEVLLIHDSNPVYSLPPALGFGEALEKVDFVVSFASSRDETAVRADLVLPDHTPLESWGDAAPRPGIRSLVQPTIRPLFDTQALGDTLLDVARAMGDDYAAKLPKGSFRGVLEAAWADTDLRAALARGGVFGGPAPEAAVSLSPEIEKLDFTPAALAGAGDHALVAYPSPLHYDGRGAALPWLQETPDPVTSISWQSWAELSHASAEALGVRTGDVLAIETTAGRIEVPAFPRGGIRDDVVAVAIGQGHTVGHFAADAHGAPRGVNVIEALPAVSDESGGRAWLTTVASLSATGRFRRLPLGSGSDNKRGRQLGEMVSLAALAKGGADAHGEDPGAHRGGQSGGHESHEIREPYDAADDSTEESAYRWGMTIDLDRCTGCSACVVACSVENNIPTVGEEGVLRGREMHWLRIERYIGDGEPTLQAGRPERRDREKLGELDVRHSPMLCQQCGAAPCEPVCPVYATYHTPEGLNGMIYNRCIGTRYCSNNCPYKVRRYNWFDYAIENWPEPMALMLNPDVTVRGQGVMEKCTFCVQRIQGARQAAKDAGRPIADGEIVTACQQTCPTDAITFGNVKDEASAAVRKADAAEARGYHALHTLNTRPSITYLAKVERDGEGHS